MANPNTVEVLKDGQLAVATTTVNGTIISGRGDQTVCALVQTDEGDQLALKVLPLDGESGGGVTEDKIIIKSATIPTASSSNYGYMYCYNGETNATYTHGYIYENKKEATYEGSITFTPNTITVSDEDFSAFLNAGIEYMPEPDKVTHGTMTYHYASGIWRLVGYDENNVEVGHRQLYQPDYEDAGFVFSGSFEDGDELTFVSTIEESSVSYSWVRVDVQPAGSAPVPAGVYTEDNLVGGTNISLDNSYSGGGIDPDTLACFHFDDSVVNASSYATEDTYQGEGGSVDLRTDSTVAYINGKFDKAISVSSENSDNHFILNPNYLSYYDEITFEFWLKYKSLQINATQVGLYGQSGQYTGGWNFMSLYPGGATSYLWVSTVGGLNSNRQLTNEEQSYVNNDWNHLALCCKKGVFTKFYINGHLIINDTTHTSLSNYQFDPAEAKLNVLFFDPNCGIDEIRLSKTLRYTGDTFEVPNAPFSTSYTTIKKINNTMSAPSVMTGATSGAAGTSGLVPAPAAGDQAKYLTGAGTWQTVNALQNNSTGTNSLAILGTTSSGYNTLVGSGTITAGNFCCILGYDAKSSSYASDTVVIGAMAECTGGYSIAIGESAKSQARYALALGVSAKASGERSIAMGGASPYETPPQATANFAIQIGPGTNSTANTFSVGLDASHNYQVLDANGQIPAARLGTGFDASKTQVLKNVNGVLTWVDEA